MMVTSSESEPNPLSLAYSSSRKVPGVAPHLTPMDAVTVPPLLVMFDAVRTDERYGTENVSVSGD